MAGLIRALPVLLLLLCPAGALATPAAAPAPAPATGLEAEEVCVGVGTNNTALACLANLSASCLAVSAITEETAYLGCFVGGYLGGQQQCLAGPRRAEKSCIGIEISDERLVCFGLAGWSCQDNSFFGFAGFFACYIGTSIRDCLF